MEKNDVIKALETVKDISSKKNFKQTIDLIITLKDIDLKNTDNHLNLFIPLQFPSGKNVKVCGLVGPELMDQAKKAFDTAISIDDFEQFQKNPKTVKKLADEHAYFVAQATIMPKVASAFGRVLGTRGKMPNPKAGCVVPPGANLQALYERLKKTTKATVKTFPHIQCSVGKEDQDINEVADNIMTLYDNVIHKLPGEENNIKNVMIKYTMGPAVIIGKHDEAAERAKTGKKPAKKEVTKEEKGAE